MFRTEWLAISAIWKVTALRETLRVKGRRRF